MNLSGPQHYPEPPRLLLGAALMAWGGLTNHALIALGVALLVEGRNWLNWRWQFGLRGYSRAWILSLIALAGVVGFHSLNMVGPEAMLAFLGWLPLIFLPLILAQQYGEDQAVPTTVFSVIARRRLMRERRLGKSVPDSRIHLGYPYLFMTLLAASVNIEEGRQQWEFFVVLIVLSSLGLFFANVKEQRRFLPWLVTIVIVASTSMASSHGLINLYAWVKDGGLFQQPPEEDFRKEQTTAIGTLGKLKLSNRIQWRANVPPASEPPARIMTLAYNNYRGGKWQSLDPNFQDYERAFNGLQTTANKKDQGEFAFQNQGFEVNDQKAPQYSTFRLRGAIDSNRKPLPVPPGPVLFTEAQEIDSIEKGYLGTLLAINAANVVDLLIYSGKDTSLREEPPIQTMRGNTIQRTTLDLKLPVEKNTLNSIASGLGLKKMSDVEKITALRQYFSENFAYTTHLKTTNKNGSTALENFLLQTREGHCEYFGTATTLLLRAAGVPARYAVGYVVREEGKEPGDYVIRGTHAHAWCRAYLGGTKETVQEEVEEFDPNGRVRTITKPREVWTGGRWVDIDLTPPAWLAEDIQEAGFKDRFLDFFQRLREDFQIWRANDANRGWVNLVLIGIAALVLAFVIWRLKGTAIRRKKEQDSERFQPQTSETSLNRLVPELEAQFGPKPQGQLLLLWLQSILPELPRQTLERVFALHEQERFSFGSLNPPEQIEFETLVQTLSQTCAQRKDQ